MIVLSSHRIDYSGYFEVPKWVEIKDHRLLDLWHTRHFRHINPMAQRHLIVNGQPMPIAPMVMIYGEY